jgi:hypothetical protein
MNTLIEKANASQELSELPLRSTDVEQGNSISPVLATPGAFAAGVAAAGAVAGAVAAGAAIGDAID